MDILSNLPQRPRQHLFNPKLNLLGSLHHPQKQATPKKQNRKHQLTTSFSPRLTFVFCRNTPDTLAVDNNFLSHLKSLNERNQTKKTRRIQNGCVCRGSLAWLGARLIIWRVTGPSAQTQKSRARIPPPAPSSLLKNSLNSAGFALGFGQTLPRALGLPRWVCPYSFRQNI